MFFFLATRLGASVVMMKLALLACEAVTVLMIVLQQPPWAAGHPHRRLCLASLPLWEIANNGHIDALMVSLLMLGLWLAVTHVRAARGSRRHARRACSFLRRARAPGDLAALELETAAGCRRRRGAVLPALSVD
ncbi:MAG: hypothetical protein R3D62_03205 [Xanthobacteraceae bacterium]